MFLKNEVLVMKECPKQFFLEISTKSILSIKSFSKIPNVPGILENVPRTFLVGEHIMNIAGA